MTPSPGSETVSPTTRITHDGANVTIAMGSKRSIRLVLVAASVALLILAVAWFAGAKRVEAVLGARHLAVPIAVAILAVAYVGLVKAVNKSTVRIEGGRFTVRSGPLPWFGSHTLATSAVTDVEVAQVDEHSGESAPAYRAQVKTTTGTIRLATFTTRKDAELVASAVSDALR